MSRLRSLGAQSRFIASLLNWLRLMAVPALRASAASRSNSVPVRSTLVPSVVYTRRDCMSSRQEANSCNRGTLVSQPLDCGAAVRRSTARIRVFSSGRDRIPAAVRYRAIQDRWYYQPVFEPCYRHPPRPRQQNPHLSDSWLELP